jgi:hypothetical protein
MVLRAAAAVAVVAFTSIALASPAADIDKAEWQDANAWACATTIAITPPTVPANFKGEQPADAYTRKFAEGLAAGLRKRFGDAAVTVVAATDTPTSDLVISGEFATLDTGSKSKRFWVGFGAGKSWADLRLHAVRRATGSAVFSIRQERGSAAGFVGDALMANVDQITHDVVAYLDGVHGTCDRTAWERTGAIESASVPVAFTTNPAGADVYVDGTFVGTTPLTQLRLIVGSHAVEFRKAGFKTWSKPVGVLQGTGTEVSVELEAEPPKE